MGRRPQTQEPRGILLRSEQSLHVSFGGVHPILRSLSSRFPRASGPVCLNTDMALCWWCEAREADSKEHKYKRKDLLRLMGEGEGLVWFGDDNLHRDLQGKGALKRDRYKILKFQKSLCSTCNNARSQPFDLAYDKLADYLTGHDTSIYRRGSVPLYQVYDLESQEERLNLGRYLTKHFASRMAEDGLTVPAPLRQFLDGSEELPDCTMVLAAHNGLRTLPFDSGIHLSPCWGYADREDGSFSGWVSAYYLGYLGVRFEWNRRGISDSEYQQFFRFDNPLLNYFEHDEAVRISEVSKRPLSARLLNPIPRRHP